MLDVCRWSMDSLRLPLDTRRQCGCTEHRECCTCCSVQQLHKEPNSVKLVEVALFDCRGKIAMIFPRIGSTRVMIQRFIFIHRAVSVLGLPSPNDFSMSQWKHRCFSNNPCECSVLYESQKHSVSRTDNLYPSFSLSICLPFACVTVFTEAGGKKLRSTIQRSTETGLAVEMRSRMTRQASRESTDGSMNSYSSEGK